MAKTKANTIKIKLVKSLIGTNPNQRAVARALGFTKKDQVVEHASTPTILGMVNKVSHLVEIVK